MDQILTFCGYLIGVFVVASLSYGLIRELCGITALMFLLAGALAAQNLTDQIGLPFYFTIPICGAVSAIISFPLFQVLAISQLEEQIEALKEHSAAYQTKFVELEDDLSEFSIMLYDAGIEKVKVIKVVREITGAGLKEAKDIVDGAPKLVKDVVTKAKAEEFVRKLKEAGAKASLLSKVN
jgi:ribosomal protein L7/L12